MARFAIEQHDDKCGIVHENPNESTPSAALRAASELLESWAAEATETGEPEWSPIMRELAAEAADHDTADLEAEDGTVTFRWPGGSLVIRRVDET